MTSMANPQARLAASEQQQQQQQAHPLNANDENIHQQMVRKGRNCRQFDYKNHLNSFISRL
jgi:hypothetical protein